jgi:lysophospholipase L1-like esterase
MKKLLSVISCVALLAVISSCDEYNELTSPTVNLGSADFSRFVTIGNSLTAGYQAGSLYQSSQMYSLGKLIADAVGASFEQPYFSDPGTGGRLEIESLDPFSLSTNTAMGSPLNSNLPAPYNNLGVPGALTYDILGATNANDCASAIFANTPNPMFDLILRNSALNIGSQFNQAQALNPTMILFWIGNNDVLGFAASGGVSPADPTPLNVFTVMYTTIADSLASLGADVIVGNVFDVTSIAFFTTVGPQMAWGIPWGQLAQLGAPGLFYQEHGNTGPSMVFTDSLSLLTGGVLVTLRGSSYAGLVGTPNGQFYRDFGYPALPAGIDTMQAFGVHPQNPWPDALILDAGEKTTAQNATQGYNDVISAQATAKGFGLVDFNSIFNQIRMSDFTGGTVINGITYKTTFIEGGLFSVDGVHPTNQAQGIMANAFIEVINSRFNANIPLIKVSTIPGSLNFTSGTSVNKGGYVKFSKDAFDHLFF